MRFCIDCKTIGEVPLMKRGGGMICPKCLGEIARTEEFFLLAVNELNEKGYFVRSCVPGSIDVLNKESSILFDECIDSLPGLTNDCYVEVVGEKGSQAIKLVYPCVDCETPLSILRNSINIYTWAIKLPTVSSDEYYNTCKTC